VPEARNGLLRNEMGASHEMGHYVTIWVAEQRDGR